MQREINSAPLGVPSPDSSNGGSMQWMRTLMAEDITQNMQSVAESVPLKPRSAETVIELPFCCSWPIIMLCGLGAACSLVRPGSKQVMHFTNYSPLLPRMIDAF